MIILALDTSMAACSAAVVDTEHPVALAEACAPMERGHAEALAPMIDDVVVRAGIGFSSLDRIAVTTGPGTFTGVRIGLAMGRGLGLALGIPVAGLDSLSAIAANDSHRDLPVAVVAEARNGEVYAARFDAQGRLVSAPHVTTAAAVGREAEEGSLLLGTGADAVISAQGGRQFTRSLSGDLPVASRFARLAASLEAAGMPSPLYLRAPDAKPQAQPSRLVRPFRLIKAGPEASGLAAAIHAEGFAEPWSAEAFAQLIASPGASLTIAEENGEPVGFLLVRQAADEAEIISIAARIGSRRRGVAGQLLDRQLAEFLERGMRHVFLEVAESNAGALALYRNRGFAEAGRRRGYYRLPGGGSEDAIVMKAELSR